MEGDAMAARPSKRTRTSTAARGWSNLSSEICGVILSRVPSLADRARFRSVCRQWRHAARQQWGLLPPALPWLTTSHKCAAANGASSKWGEQFDVFEVVEATRLLLVRSKWGEQFDVFEADEASGRWSEVTRLADNEALFVGAHGSKGLQTASRNGGGGVRGNRIYFAGETHPMRIGIGNPASLGVYDMESKTTSDIGLPRGSFVDDYKPTGSWLFPSTAHL